MNRQLLIRTVAFALLMLALTGLGASAWASLATPASHSSGGGTPPSTNLPSPSGPNTVLYDQYDNSSINSTNSQQYEPTMTPYNDFCADDFVVPAGQTWTIDEVDAAGVIVVGNGPVEGFNITIYTNASGLPGTQVYAATNQSFTNPVQGEYAITLSTPAVIGQDTYWVMVQGIACWFCNPMEGQWDWVNRGVQSYNPAAWTNPGDGWGTTCNDVWGVRWRCQGDLPHPDQVYRLVGTSTGGATDTPTDTPVPATPTATATQGVPPTNTQPPTATNTAPPQPTDTPGGPTSTATSTSLPTATATNTQPPQPTDTRPPQATNTAPPATTQPTSTRVPPTATSCPVQFTDVPAGSTFYDPVRCLACRDVISGYPDGTFRPNNPVTRGQLSKIITRSVGWSEPIPLNHQSFEDVDPASTFWVFVERMLDHGAISGYPCGQVPSEPCVPPTNRPYFRPNADATRGQVSKIVSTAANFQDDPGGQRFQDVPTDSPFFVWIDRLVIHGVISGYACGAAGEPCVPPANLPYFRPNANVTRGQLSKMAANTFFPGCVTPSR